MSAGSVVYNRGKFLLTDPSFDWTSATVRCVLLKNVQAGASSPDLNFVSDVIAGGVADECTAGGVTRQPLATRTRTEDDTNDRVNFDADNVAFGNVGDNTETAQKMLVYQRVGADDSTPADDPVIALIGFPDTVLNGGAFTVNIADLIRAT